MGRPSAISIHDGNQFFGQHAPPGNEHGINIDFHEHKFGFAAHCLFPASQIIQDTAPSTHVYTNVLEVDNRIRTYPVPDYLKSPYDFPPIGAWSSSPLNATRQYWSGGFRDYVLLYLHRPYCRDALFNRRGLPLQHQYGPSLLAACSAARRIYARSQAFYRAHPDKAGPLWFVWHSIYMGCVVMAALIVEKP
ncbi:hypothetical protein PUNSTDRAFT_145388, partial [Punctularia strigosozonata HHB-11173 SS5]|uniref:uncharacterized protein n=1 Tax=Punctularia strigosozonata (strain HHB-11173) TaxID=741275 RepID=UPI0004416BF8